MAVNTAIEWTHRVHPVTGEVHQGGSVNFWIGCTQVDPACDLCYAMGEDALKYSRTCGGTKDEPVIHWGPGAPRWRTKNAASNARAIQRAALKAGIPLAAFTNSLSDFFDTEVPDDWRADAFDIIYDHKAIDWMILTKRAHKMRQYLTASAWWMDRHWHERENDGPEHVWLGVTAATKAGVQKRVPDLCKTPAHYRFISAEPLIEDIADELEPFLATQRIDLVIVGGESDVRGLPGKARPMHPDWCARLRDLCWATGTAFFFKQWGAWCPAYELDHNPQAQAMCLVGNVERHEFPTGAEGRRFVYRVGKHISGNKLDGRLHKAMPPARTLPAGLTT